MKQDLEKGIAWRQSLMPVCYTIRRTPDGYHTDPNTGERHRGYAFELALLEPDQDPNRRAVGRELNVYMADRYIQEALNRGFAHDLQDLGAVLALGLHAYFVQHATIPSERAQASFLEAVTT